MQNFLVGTSWNTWNRKSQNLEDLRWAGAEFEPYQPYVDRLEMGWARIWISIVTKSSFERKNKRFRDIQNPHADRTRPDTFWTV